MALRWLRWSLLAEMVYTTFLLVALGCSQAMHEFSVLLHGHWQCGRMGHLPGPTLTSVHMGTCWLAESALVSFLQRLPLPRLVHFLVPSAVPLPLRTATSASSYRRRTSCTWWARGGISFKCDFSCSGRGRASCMSPLPGTTNRFCFDHCIASESYHRVFPNGGWTPLWQATDSNGVALRPWL